MASESKKTKSETPAKKDAPAKAESTAAEAAPKDAPKDAPKSGSGETAGTAPANYSRGEGQKPVTAAYKENWNAIFAKKSTKRKKR